MDPHGAESPRYILLCYGPCRQHWKVFNFIRDLKPETAGSIAQVGINRDKSFGLSTGGPAHWKYEGAR